MEYISITKASRAVADYIKSQHKELSEPGFKEILLKRSKGGVRYYKLVMMPLWKMEEYNHGAWAFHLFTNSPGGMIGPIQTKVDRTREKVTYKDVEELVKKYIEKATPLLVELEEGHDMQDEADDIIENNNKNKMGRFAEEAKKHGLSLKMYMKKITDEDLDRQDAENAENAEAKKEEGNK